MKSRRLKPVANATETKLNQAVRALGSVQSELHLQLARLQELKSYQSEYQQRFKDHSGGGTNLTQIMNYRTFMLNLDRAIAQQNQMVAATEKKLHQQRKVWQQLQSKLKALETVVQKYELAEQKDQDRKEQKEVDDRARRGTKR